MYLHLVNPVRLVKLGKRNSFIYYYRKTQYVPICIRCNDIIDRGINRGGATKLKQIKNTPFGLPSSTRTTDKKLKTIIITARHRANIYSRRVVVITSKHKRIEYFYILLIYRLFSLSVSFLVCFQSFTRRTLAHNIMNKAPLAADFDFLKTRNRALVLRPARRRN